MHTSSTKYTVALSKLEAGRLPSDIFKEVARLTVTPVVEIVPLYKDENDHTKVVLLQKGIDDIYWPAMYHVPGAIVLATDTPGSFSDALERVLKGKLAKYQLADVVFVDTALSQVSRGMEVAIVYVARVESVPDDALLFSIDALPDNIVEGHLNFISSAFEKFETT